MNEMVVLSYLFIGLISDPSEGTQPPEKALLSQNDIVLTFKA